MMKVLKQWMKKCNRKWEKMKKSLKRIVRELEKMRNREEM